MRKLFLLTLVAILMCSISALALVPMESFTNNLTNVSGTGWTVWTLNTTVNYTTSPVVFNTSTTGSNVWGTLISSGVIPAYNFNISVLINQSYDTASGPYMFGTGISIGDGEDLNNGAIGCIFANSNYSGTQKKYLVLYNDTRASFTMGPTLVAVTNQTYGTLTLKYNNATSVYTCTFGNATLSGVGRKPSDFVGPYLLLTHESLEAGAPGTAFGNSHSYFYNANYSTAYTAPVPITIYPLANFTENCNAALNTSFWNTSYDVGGAFLDGAATGVGKWYMNSSNSSTGKVIVSTYNQVQNRAFNYSAEVALFPVNLSANAGYVVGLSLGKTSAIANITCALANFTSVYGTILYEEIADVPVNYTSVVSPLNGTLTMSYNNVTNHIYCTYGTAIVGSSVTLPSSTYNVGVYNNLIDTNASATTGRGYSYIDNIAFTYLASPYTPPVPVVPVPSTSSTDNGSSGMTYVLVAFGIFVTIICAAVIIGLVVGGVSFNATMIIGLVIVLAVGTAVLIAILSVLSRALPT